ncbi:MAG: Bax inhibitor-1/YccA family protein [Treponema sp.]|uniref:Bax inhibitor-1/YccA family protein n=1 Tax=Treponema sp. TaxID=166 RepID=UPI00360CE75A
MNTSPDNISLQQANEKISQRFITAVYGWMVAALAISGLAAFAVFNSRTLARFIFGSNFTFMGLILAEFALVIILSAGIRKMSFPVAAVSFVIYSIVNGLTLSVVLFAYTRTSVASIFVITALMFGAMSVYGATTKSSLQSAGKYLMMAVIGLVIASLVNIFMRSSSLDWLISFVTVGVFTGLTAYDTQKITQAARYAQDNEDFKKVAIIGALELYLDFVNIFLALLRLFGKRR